MIPRYTSDEHSHLFSLYEEYEPHSYVNSFPSPRVISRIRIYLLNIIPPQDLDYATRHLQGDRRHVPFSLIFPATRRPIFDNVHRYLANPDIDFSDTIRDIERRDQRREALRRLDIFRLLPLVPEIGSTPLIMTADDLVDLIVQSSKASYRDIQAIDIRQYTLGGPMGAEGFVAVYNVSGERFITGTPATMYVCLTFGYDPMKKSAMEILRDSKDDDEQDAKQVYENDGSDENVEISEWMISMPRVSLYLMDPDDTPISLQRRNIDTSRLCGQRPQMTLGRLSHIMRDLVDRLSCWEIGGLGGNIAGKACYYACTIPALQPFIAPPAIYGRRGSLPRPPE